MGVKKIFFPVLIIFFPLSAYLFYEYFGNFLISGEWRLTEQANIKSGENSGSIDLAEEASLAGKKKDFKNVILIGWDGAQRDRLYKLSEEGKMPNFRNYFKKNGSCSDITITTGATKTAPGWAEILTGYSYKITGVFNNTDYKPIAKGYTIFERLEEFFGKENIVSLFVVANKDNLGADGPHQICTNCYSFHKLMRSLKKVSGEDGIIEEGTKPILKNMEGEPYYFTRESLDIYINDLGLSQDVQKRVFEYLNLYKNNRFFMFMHLEEPDLQGHKSGVDSKEYDDVLIENDRLIVELVAKLEQLDIYDETLLYLTTDHGFDEASYEHKNAMDIFLCSNEKGLKKNGDRKDATPTILSRYGVDIDKIKPALEGASLYEK